MMNTDTNDISAMRTAHLNTRLAMVTLAIILSGLGWVYERARTTNARIKELSARLQVIDANVVAINSDLESVNSNFKAIDAKVGSINVKVGSIDAKINGLKAPPNDRISVREFMIRSQIAQANSPVVFIGDSITEAALLPSEICGHDVINAGIGGMGSASYGALAEDFLRPVAIAVVAIGTNDTKLSVSAFSNAYEELLNKIHADGLILVGPPPMDDSGSPHELDATAIEPFNTAVSEIAVKHRAAFIHPTFSNPPNTVDGIHLSVNGYKQWLHPILATLHSALGC